MSAKQVTYTQLIESGRAYVKADQGNEVARNNAADNAREFFGSRANMEEAKSDYMVNAILPALKDKKHAEALAHDLPRKTSKEYKDLDAAGRDKWAQVTAAKKTARSVLDVYFNRVLDRAFPKQKDDTENPPKSQLLKLQEHIAAIAKILEKAEGIDGLDIVKATELNNELGKLCANAK